MGNPRVDFVGSGFFVYFEEQTMHFYWRVIEELKSLGETWIFRDPSLARSYEHWLKRNADALAIINKSETVERSPLFEYIGVPHSLS